MWWRKRKAQSQTETPNVFGPASLCEVVAFDQVGSWIVEGGLSYVAARRLQDHMILESVRAGTDVEYVVRPER